jgi:ABC-type dipeptide/oligopeptide/nickel transport system permease subunit
VLSTIFLPIAILAEAAISFLGVGVPEGTPSWGADMSGANRVEAFQGSWWVVFFPGLALSVVVLGFNLVGDAFRDISDPRLRGGGGSGSGM